MHNSSARSDRAPSAERFAQFSSELRAGLREIGVPDTDVVVQGSSLRTPSAGDVDVAVFVSEVDFNRLLVERFQGRARYTSGAAVPLEPEGLQRLAREVEVDEALPGGSRRFNANARTLMHAVLSGKIRPQDISGLGILQASLADRYGNLQVSVMARGRSFDVRPTMPLR